MTISENEALASGPYSGNGSTTVFDYDFTIYHKSELNALRQNADGTVTTLVVDTDYTVAGVGVTAGGTITLTSGSFLPTGSTLTIEPDITPSQERPFDTQSSTTLAEIEKSLDKLTSLIRQSLGSVGRALRVSVADEAAGFNPEFSNEGGTFLRIRDDGTGFENVKTTIDVSAAEFQYAERSASTALAAYNLGDGKRVLLGQQMYLVDTTKTGANSHTSDIGQDGLVEAGLRYTTRARFLEAVARGEPFNQGDTVVAGGFSYVYRSVVYTGGVPGAPQFDPAGNETFVEHFGAVADGLEASPTDNQSAIQAAIDHAQSGYDRSRVVRLSAGYYGVASSLIYRTGVTLEGCGSQSSVITATAAMDAIITAADTTGATDYFRFRMKSLWLRGQAQADYGVRLVSHRDGQFDDVYVDGTINAGWYVREECYYNRWTHCRHNGPGRGWLVFSDSAQSPLLSPNENSLHHCRKNQGTDGVALITSTVGFNRWIVNDMAVEAHSGAAILLSASNASNPIWDCTIKDLRVDSTVSGAKGIQITGGQVYRTKIRGGRFQLTTASNNFVLSGDPQGTTFTDGPWNTSLTASVNFGTIAANSYVRRTFNITDITANTGTHVVCLTASSGAIPDDVFITARLSASNTVEVMARSQRASAVTISSDITVVVDVRRVT